MEKRMEVYRRMCAGHMQTVCYFIDGDGIHGGSWNPALWTQRTTVIHHLEEEGRI
jgi:hypothetical protein